VESLSDQVEVQAPVLFYNLRRSGHPSVTLGGALIYDRAPYQPRLTEAQLRALNRTIRLPGAIIGHIWWDVMKMPHAPQWYKHRGLR
jgi:hypothetical protein